MQLESILTPARTLCDAPGTSKKRVLENLAQFLAEDLPDTDAADLFARLLARERLGSTGLGGGIALPHCRLKSVERAIGCLVTLAQPIEFEAVDDNPVDVLFVLLVPEAATQEHLNVLAALAERFSDPAYTESLRAASTSEELYEAAIA
ncbi:MAG: PTS IIA-like nitrogen regulatory protein PtsN [Spongiibacteraceae bacterium]|nr:PTS IIA-like nitrogen regulatory protein PtsN [Spongiibacteraceae bacterium]